MAITSDENIFLKTPYVGEVWRLKQSGSNQLFRIVSIETMVTIVPVDGQYGDGSMVWYDTFRQNYELDREATLDALRKSIEKIQKRINLLSEA
jgi:hypothetical protein